MSNREGKGRHVLLRMGGQRHMVSFRFLANVALGLALQTRRAKYVQVAAHYLEQCNADPELIMMFNGWIESHPEQARRIARAVSQGRLW